MMIRCIEIPLISPSKSFWITFQVVCTNQDELWGAKSKTKKNDYTIHHGVFFVDDLIHFFQALPVSDERSLLSLPNEHRPPTIMTKFSFFSVIAPPVKT